MSLSKRTSCTSPPTAGVPTQRAAWGGRTSCSKATANQFRLLIHTAAYWLLHRLRELAPKTAIWRDAQFDTLRLAFVKVAARVTELVTRIKVSLPSSYPYKESLARFAGRALARPP